MKYKVYVSQATTYRYLVEADNAEDAETLVTLAIEEHGLETGNYNTSASGGWDVVAVEEAE